MAKTKLARHNKLRNYGLALGSFIIAFILGTTLIAPIFDRRFDVFNIHSNPKEVQAVADQEPEAYNYWYAPSNSFGISSTKEVNWTHFKQLFQSHTNWALEYKRFSSSAWANGNQYLTINRTWNESGFWKLNLILDAPINIYSARFTFGCNLSVLDYVERSGYEIWLNYSANQTETYSVMFNWSDIASIPDLTITKGRTDNLFWFRFQKDNIKKGHYEFDPTFGDATGSTGYSTTIFYDQYGSHIKKIADYFLFSGGSSTTAQSMSFYYSLQANVDPADSTAIRLCVYQYVTSTDASNLLGYTNLIYINGTPSYGWYSANFVVVPTLVNTTNYFLSINIISTTLDGATEAIYTSRYNDNLIKHIGDNDLGLENPWLGESVVSYKLAGIYCTYSLPPSNTAPTITANSQNPKNQSTNVGLSLAGNYSHFNITVADANDATQNMNITWKTNESGSWTTMGTNASVNNGTYYCTNISWVDEYSHKYWWRVSVNDGCGGWANATYYFTTAAPSMSWHTVNTWNGTLTNTSAFIQIADFNGTIFNSSNYNQINLWNGSIFNETNWIQISLFNGTVYNESTWSQVNQWNGTIFNTSQWNLIDEYNGTIYNISAYIQVSLWNGTIFNTSSWNDVVWNGTIYNTTRWSLINEYNGSIYNTSAFETINDWNGSIYNVSNWFVTSEYNGTIFNTSIGFVIVDDWNGSLYNQSNFNLVQLWNGSIFNTSNYETISLWNGSLFNQSNYHLIQELNGTVYNISIGFVLVQESNGTIWNQSIWNQIELWNGTVYNASNYHLIQDWNGTLYNQSQYHLINQWNGSLYNVSIGFVLIDDWNGTIWNQSIWQDIDWNGTIFNASSYHQIALWNGSLFNTSSWHQVDLWNGSLYNISIGWTQIQEFNGTIWNQSSWHDIEWNGSIYNTSGYNQISLWNGTLFNQSTYHLIQEYNGTIYNTSIGFILINNWNGSVYNQSTWNLIQNWNGSICNQTTSNLIQEWNGSIYNASHSYEINTWNGSIYNTSSFNTISDWNGTIFNSSLFNLVNQWNGSIYNQSSYNQVEQWNGTIYNISIGFVLVQNWNGSIYNQSSWSQVSLWNGTVFNTSAFEIITNWNGTVYNQSQAHTINLWNGTIFNVSGMIQIQDWNGTIYNASTFNQILLWNGSIFNTTFYIQINLWNGTIFNTTGAMLIQEWNGSIYNGTGLGAIITISNPYPGNNSDHIKINVTLSITISHLNGNQMNITWYWGNSSANATHYLGSTLNVINGTYSMAITPANHTYTDYWWSVNVTSGTDYASTTYNFTTGMKSGMAMTRDRFIIGISIGIIVIFGFLGILLYRRKSRYEE